MLLLCTSVKRGGIMNQFPPSFSEHDIQQAKAGISPLTLEYIERLEWVARTATAYKQSTTAFTPDAYQASMNLSAALSRITLVRPAKSWHEFVTSGRASHTAPTSQDLGRENDPR